MATNVGCGSSVYRPMEQEGSACDGLGFARIASELKFHGPFLAIVLMIVGAIHFLT